MLSAESLVESLIGILTKNQQNILLVVCLYIFRKFLKYLKEH